MIPRGQRMSFQLFCSALLVIVGCGLLIAGFIVSPLGEIHNSVLIAFGEILTFIGSTLGIDYHYKYNRILRDNENTDKQRTRDKDSGQTQSH